MTIKTEAGQSRQESARAWVLKLARYREPSTWRSVAELAVTLVPFLFLWALAWVTMDVSAWLSLGIAVLNGGFLVRIFVISTIAAILRISATARCRIGSGGRWAC